MAWSGKFLTGLALLALVGCATADRHRPAIAAPASCADLVFPIYFEPGSAAVTREAEQRITAAGLQAARCRVTGVDVVGLSDAAGAPGANLALSERRADSVTRALARHGLGTAPLRVEAAGAANSSVAGGEVRPVRRRADVTIRLAAH